MLCCAVLDFPKPLLELIVLVELRHFIVYRKLSSGLQGETEAEAHGSILMAAALLDHGGGFMVPRYDETCTHVMKLRNHPSQ